MYVGKEPLPEKMRNSHKSNLCPLKALGCTYEYGVLTQPHNPSNKSCCPPAPRTKIDQCCPFPSAHSVAGVATCVTTFLGFACLECTGQPHLLQRLGQKVETGIFVMVSRYLYTMLYINAKGNYVPCFKQKNMNLYDIMYNTIELNIHL